MIRRPGLFPLIATLGIVAMSCGGGANPAGPAATTPSPATTPTPSATPTPSPVPTPSPSASPCTVGLCEPPVVNKNPVARVVLKLYQCLDQNRQPEFCPDPVKQVVVEPRQVNHYIKLDVTGKDADNMDTNGPTGDGEGISFVYSDPSMIEESILNNWQRWLKITKAGKWEVYAIYDGVGSNSLGFTFVP